MQDGIDRRTFLRVAGAGAAASTVWRPGADGARRAHARRAARPERARRRDRLAAPRLRRRIRQPWIRTPNIDALAQESLRFTRAFPEAMPTVPARRSLMMGRRVYPWHDWRPTRNLPGSPGWTGLGADTTTWLKTLRRHGYWTGYVTDNPFLGFAPEWAGFRSTLDRFVRSRARSAPCAPARTVSEREVLRWLPPRMRDERYLHRHAPAPRQRRRRARRARLVRRARLRLRRSTSAGARERQHGRSRWSSTASTRTSRGRRRRSTSISTAGAATTAAGRAMSTLPGQLPSYVRPP